jgi:Mg2+/citrate symporter
VPAILLLVTLAGVSLADHHRKVLWRTALVSLSTLAIGVLLGQFRSDLFRLCPNRFEPTGAP